MQAKKKRLTLDMDPGFQRRLKATAALKGISMRQYCLTAIDRELGKDEVDADRSVQMDANGSSDQRSNRPLSERFEALRKEVFGDTVLPGSSADLIREAREIRNAQMDNW